MRVQVEAAPELGRPVEGPPVRFDDIMNALKSLDVQAAKSTNYPKLMNRARRIKDLYRKDGGGGIFLN
jgi:hypothetical protein